MRDIRLPRNYSRSVQSISNDSQWTSKLSAGWFGDDNFLFCESLPTYYCVVIGWVAIFYLCSCVLVRISATSIVALALCYAPGHKNQACFYQTQGGDFQLGSFCLCTKAAELERNKTIHFAPAGVRIFEARDNPLHPNLSARTCYRPYQK